MGGGKGGTKTTKVELPPELEQGSAGVLGAALQSASLPYRANRGITIAGFSPDQEASFDNTRAAASAFGLTPGEGNYLPEQKTGAGGVRGYSTGALFDENVSRSMTPQDQQRRLDLLQNYGLIGNKILSGEQLGSTKLNMTSPYGSRQGGK